MVRCCPGTPARPQNFTIETSFVGKFSCDPSPTALTLDDLRLYTLVILAYVSDTIVPKKSEVG